MAAVAVAAGSVIVPFALGLGTGLVLPREFLGEGKGTVVFALFIGAALSISSLPVITKILSELGMTRRNFGQLTLADGMTNDVIGWLVRERRGGTVGAMAVTLAGIVLGQSKFQDGRVRSDLESITLTVFAPLFSLPLGCGWI